MTQRWNALRGANQREEMLRGIMGVYDEDPTPAGFGQWGAHVFRMVVALFAYLAAIGALIFVALVLGQ